MTEQQRELKDRNSLYRLVAKNRDWEIDNLVRQARDEIEDKRKLRQKRRGDFKKEKYPLIPNKKLKKIWAINDDIELHEFLELNKHLVKASSRAKVEREYWHRGRISGFTFRWMLRDYCKPIFNIDLSKSNFLLNKMEKGEQWQGGSYIIPFIDGSVSFERLDE